MAASSARALARLLGRARGLAGAAGAAAGVAACGVAFAPLAHAEPHPPAAAPPPKPAPDRRPFDDPELSATLPERAARSQHLHRYVRSVEPRVRAAMEAGDEAALLALREEIGAKQESILFGTLPGERGAYLRRFGCAAWSREALEACAEHSPLVEVGAGAGHWARALSGLPDRAVDVLAYDDGSAVPLGQQRGAAGRVSPGGPEVLRGPEAAGRTLLLVYPPPTDMAARCLREYRGEWLIYVGEARGGYNADAAFFDALRSGWRLKRSVDTRPFRGGYERLYVFKRRHAWARRAWRGAAVGGAGS